MVYLFLLVNFALKLPVSYRIRGSYEPLQPKLDSMDKTKPNNQIS